MRFSLSRNVVLGAGLGTVLGLIALVLLASSPTAVAGKPLPPRQKAAGLFADQIVAGYPLTITVSDDTQMDIRYRHPDHNQFFGNNAEGLYLWVNVAGITTVFGPASVPRGNSANPYAPVSNVLSGVGTPNDPWVITTVNLVPGTNLRLTQVATYVNGAEFTHLDFKVEQIGGSTPATVTLFHAADLFNGGCNPGYNCNLGFGYYDSSAGGVGDYITPPTSTLTLYQQFVPNTGTPADTFEEAYYGAIWQAIGDTSGPGPGFDHIFEADYHDSGAGLQWNLTIPAGGSVTVGDTDLFSPHASLCGSFSDVPYGSYYYDFIYSLVCRGIASGYADTTFRPNFNTTRGQLAKIAANSAGFSEAVSGQTFADVPPTNGFYPSIERMANRGLISGYTCGGPSEPCDPQHRPYFRWGASVTRGQLAKILANAKGLTGTPTGQTFRDVPSTNPFYVYVERLAAAGSVSGYACGGPGEPCPGVYFRLGNNATRGQISKIDKLTFFP